MAKTKTAKAAAPSHASTPAPVVATPVEDTPVVATPVAELVRSVLVNVGYPADDIQPKAVHEQIVGMGREDVEYSNSFRTTVSKEKSKLRGGKGKPRKAKATATSNGKATAAPDVATSVETLAGLGAALGWDQVRRMVDVLGKS